MADRTWRASEARDSFPEVMKLALSGAPQVVRHRGGGEVVVVSRKDYEALRPTMKEYLLRGGPCADDDDELEQIIARNRAEGITMLPRPRTGEE